jgi:hypothetical protein
MINESKHEIPAPMLEAAAKAMMALQGTDGCITTQDLAEAALEAAGVPEMAAERERIGMALFQNGYDSGWTTDSAVEAIEAMAARIAELEAELGNIADAKSENFDMSGDFVDWARSRARWTLRENPNRIKLKSRERTGVSNGKA